MLTEISDPVLFQTSANILSETCDVLFEMYWDSWTEINSDIALFEKSDGPLTETSDVDLFETSGIILLETVPEIIESNLLKRFLVTVRLFILNTFSPITRTLNGELASIILLSSCSSSDRSESNDRWSSARISSSLKPTKKKP